MGEANDDTLPGQSAADDTLVAPSTTDAAAPRIRPSRPTLPPGTRDYPQLTVVDPAHYVIGKEIARGGMGRIQIARDRRLGREVAVKEVLVAAGSIARRFEREARITARLQHPSIISVHEAGTWPSGEPFYAMRLVTGRTLDEALDAAKTYAERLALLPNVLAIADAMAYAHREKVVHRDLKPRNVVVGEFGETVVIDWGLAKELGAVEDSLTSLPPTSIAAVAESSVGETTLGEVLGTPSYMPPEQADGKSIDERADVYAIGSILYHVLAGVPPYWADSNVAIIAMLHTGPPRPLAEVAPEIATELVAIVDRAMARDRDERYPTARELAEDLRRYQNGQLVGAHRYSLRQLLRRWMRKHRTALVAIAAATLVAVGIGIVAVRRVVAAEAVAQEERASAIAHRADVEELMGFMLGDLSERLHSIGKIDLLESVAQRAIAYFDAHTASATEQDEYLAGVAQLVLGEATHKHNEIDHARAAFATARADFARLAAKHPDDARYRVHEFHAAYLEADMLWYKGERPAAVAIYREIAPLAEANLAAHPLDPESIHAVHDAHDRLGDELETLGELDAALVEARIALDDAYRGVKVDNTTKSRRDLLTTHSKIGHLLMKGGKDIDAALVEYRSALVIGNSELENTPKDPRRLLDVAILRERIGAALAERHDPGAVAELEAARDAVLRAIAVDPTNTDASSTLSATEERLGIERFAQKDYAAALEHFKICEKIYDDLATRDPSNLDWLQGHSIYMLKLGDVYLATKNASAAIASYERGLAIRVQLVAKDPANPSWQRDLFYAHYKLAAAFRAVPNPAQVLVELRAAAAIAEANFAAHPKNQTYADDAAETHDELGDGLTGAAAQAEYRRASEIGHAMLAQPDAWHDWEKLVKKFDAKIR